MCINLHMCVCVCVRARACVFVCMRVRARMCVCVCVYQKIDTRPSIRWMFQKMEMVEAAAGAGASEESIHRSLLPGRLKKDFFVGAGEESIHCVYVLFFVADDQKTINKKKKKTLKKCEL